MHQHRHDSEVTSELRPKGARIDPPEQALAYEAAGTGRADVLDPESLGQLQRTVGNGAVASALDEDRSPVHDVVESGGGAALPTEVRHDMEARLGHDFGDVRVHTGGAAEASARSVQASAYTVGNDVVFGAGSYDPGSVAGRTTLAHELTHVVQQRSGPVDGTPRAGGVSVSDPSDRFEREAAATAERVVGGTVDKHPAAATTPAGAPTLQRDEAPEEAPPEEEMPVQTSLQRQEEEPEEEPPTE